MFDYYVNTMVVRLLFIAFSLTLFSCKKADTAKNEANNELKGEYFSIIEFAQDQWIENRGQPLGIVKKVYFNGTVDSTMTNAIEMDWASVFKVFFETDISDEKFLGQYDFSAFEEQSTTSKSFYYEAKNPKLYTRKLQIMADYFSHKITSIYIEAQKTDRIGTKNIKLFYSPLETISIHEVETSKTGDKKELRVVYEFL